MTGIGALACMIGASIIASDIPIRLIPRYRNFKIEDSTVFLSSSMALSFGVMEYSSLFSLLPESLSYLQKAGFARREAGFISTGCFIGGALAIMIVSKILHRYMPSHAVECDHSHDVEEEDSHDHEQEHEIRRSRSRVASNDGRKQHSHIRASEATAAGPTTESTPLIGSQFLSRPRYSTSTMRSSSWHKGISIASTLHSNRNASISQERKLSMVEIPRRLKEFVLDRKSNCDEGGPCYGYSDACGQECLVVVHSPTNPRRPSTIIRTSSIARSLTNLHGIEEADSESASTAPMVSSREASSDSEDGGENGRDLEAQQDDSHHHHIPTNTFLDLSLQTSIAIALHKIPEGFITYATNHVNPSLGVSVFIALLFHNLTEGFALALPLFLATGSRLRALIYSAVLGGASQPLGAGIAALWFWIAGSQEKASPSNTLYGCMFAVTSGIMMSVGMSLFCEAMAFKHSRNRNVCFAFVGMGILGITGSLSQNWRH